VSYGLEKGAEKATTLIEYAGEKQRAKTEPTAEDAKVRTYFQIIIIYKNSKCSKLNVVKS